MANTYTQINVQLVFVVKGRNCILKQSFRSDVFKYIHGILKETGQFPLATNGYLDHVHTFFELNPKNSISEIAQIVKANSSKWINESNFIGNKFSWQVGYGGFSYSRSQRDRVIKYIEGQEEHHKKVAFKDEYLGLLKAFEIEHDEKYLFDWVDLP